MGTSVMFIGPRGPSLTVMLAGVGRMFSSGLSRLAHRRLLKLEGRLGQPFPKPGVPDGRRLQRVRRFFTVTTWRPWLCRSLG